MTRETTFFLQSLAKGVDLKKLGDRMYESALTTSRNHANRILSEIKRRIILDQPELPDVEELKHLAYSNLTSLIKGQIYFIYLYNSDEIVAYMTNKLGDIYYANLENPLISRNDIKSILLNYLKGTSFETISKVVDNWIGKYLSSMREINLLIRKKKQEYFLNFWGIKPETWIFFTLHAHFRGYPLESGFFFKAFQLRNSFLPRIVKELGFLKSVSYKTSNNEEGTLHLQIETNISDLQHWLGEFQ